MMLYSGSMKQLLQDLILDIIQHLVKSVSELFPMLISGPSHETKFMFS